MRASRRVQTRMGLSDAGFGAELCDDIGRVSVSTRARELRGPMLWLRWLPAAAALIYAFVLVRRLPEIVDQLTRNADYVPVMSLAQSIGPERNPRHPIIVHFSYFSLTLAPLPVPS